MSSSNGNTDKDEATAIERRRRGRRPEDAGARRERVLTALSELESACVPFSMGDLAERAGISRATLYRDAGLRDLVGAKGNSPLARPVDRREYAALRTRVDALAEERRSLRRALREAEKRAATAEKRADDLEGINADHERARRATRTLGGHAEEQVRKESYAEGFAAGLRAASSQRGGAGPTGTLGAGLLSVASRLPRPALLAARRTLARAVHPDLFAGEPAAALLATELLKQINAIAGGSGGER